MAGRPPCSVDFRLADIERRGVGASPKLRAAALARKTRYWRWPSRTSARPRSPPLCVSGRMLGAFAGLRWRAKGGAGGRIGRALGSWSGSAAHRPAAPSGVGSTRLYKTSDTPAVPSRPVAADFPRRLGGACRARRGCLTAAALLPLSHPAAPGARWIDNRKARGSAVRRKLYSIWCDAPAPAPAERFRHSQAATAHRAAGRARTPWPSPQAAETLLPQHCARTAPETASGSASRPRAPSAAAPPPKRRRPPCATRRRRHHGFDGLPRPGSRHGISSGRVHGARHLGSGAAPTWPSSTSRACRAEEAPAPAPARS